MIDNSMKASGTGSLETKGEVLLTFPSQFMNELAFPEKHHVFLVLRCFFLHTYIAVRAYSLNLQHSFYAKNFGFSR